jgi:hypothetical protein
MAEGGKEMNEQNYASFEASKKLFDAGIILETKEYHWVEMEDRCDEFAVPAPSFGEVWRELPESYDGICKLQLRKYKDFGDYTAGPIVKNKVGVINKRCMMGLPARGDAQREEGK